MTTSSIRAKTRRRMCASANRAATQRRIRWKKFPCRSRPMTTSGSRMWRCTTPSMAARPFDREYSQSQQGGGGGGGGEEDGGQNQISRRQKEIIAATWNQIRDTKQNKATAAETAKFLAETQAKLKDQARSLAERMK